MKALLLASICLVSFGAQARVLVCDDQRDPAYAVKIDLNKGTMVAFENGKAIATEAFGKQCEILSPSTGSVEDGTACSLYKGSPDDQDTLGDIEMYQNGSIYYRAYIADRNFRGSCK